ncbi:MAG TPA: OsmC family peroxiredoxin [Bacteroides sp.]|nr:OsmC family peroxiredoxin [Bacteroides sp.]
MKETVKIDWLNEMVFEVQVDGYKLYIDSTPEHGGQEQGPRPKQLLMVALAGCTAMDVVSILKKMREEVEEFSVEVEGELAEEHPKKYTGMKVIYRVKGKNISRTNVEKAVTLSTTKYCGVTANLEEAFPVTNEIIIDTQGAGSADQ